MNSFEGAILDSRSLSGVRTSSKIVSRPSSFATSHNSTATSGICRFKSPHVKGVFPHGITTVLSGIVVPPDSRTFSIAFLTLAIIVAASCFISSKRSAIPFDALSSSARFLSMRPP